jgi:hypothetical protein
LDGYDPDTIRLYLMFIGITLMVVLGWWEYNCIKKVLGKMKTYLKQGWYYRYRNIWHNKLYRII